MTTLNKGSRSGLLTATKNPTANYTGNGGGRGAPVPRKAGAWRHPSGARPGAQLKRLLTTLGGPLCTQILAGLNELSVACSVSLFYFPPLSSAPYQPCHYHLADTPPPRGARYLIKNVSAPVVSLASSVCTFPDHFSHFPSKVEYLTRDKKKLLI